MNRIFASRRFRLLRLRASSLSLAGLLLLSIAFLLTTLWLEQATAGWFILLLFCLGLSLVLYLWRQVPVLWRDLTHYRSQQLQSRMQAMHNHVSWRFKSPADVLSKKCQSVLAQHGYQFRVSQQGDQYCISAMKGLLNRFGILLCHFALLLVLLGAWLDSDLGLKYQLRTGKLQAEMRELALNEVHARSRIPARSTTAFSGFEDVQAGQIIDEVRVHTSQGILARHLPFPVSVQSVELDTEHLLLENNYITRVAILDPKRDSPVLASLGANQPFRYRGYSYYQQSVQDAGSDLVVSMWPLQHASVVPLKFRARPGTGRRLQTRRGGIVIRFVGLNPRNVQPVQEEQQSRAVHKNIGPSLIYKVSEAFASEREFINYLLPIKQNGRYFHVTGVRHETDMPYRFIHIPVDHQASLVPYFELHSALYNEKEIKQAVEKVLGDSDKSRNTKEKRKTLRELLSIFRDGGFAAIDKNIAGRVSAENFPQSQALSHKLVRSLLYAIYVGQMGGREKIGRDEAGLLFFEDAMLALSGMAEITMPFYIQLQDMTFKPAVRVMVSYRPGELLVLGGGLLLLMGLIAVFYTWHRRLWLLFDRKDNETQVSMAGMGNRQRRQFNREFNELFASLQKVMQES